MFYRRTTHVAELQMGIPANRLEDACAIDHFDTSRLPFITLLGESIDIIEIYRSPWHLINYNRIWSVVMVTLNRQKEDHST